jgi:hypothetical protein
LRTYRASVAVNRGATAVTAVVVAKSAQVHALQRLAAVVVPWVTHVRQLAAAIERLPTAIVSRVAADARIAACARLTAHVADTLLT